MGQGEKVGSPFQPLHWRGVERVGLALEGRQCRWREMEVEWIEMEEVNLRGEEGGPSVNASFLCSQDTGDMDSLARKDQESCFKDKMSLERQLC